MHCPLEMMLFILFPFLNKGTCFIEIVSNCPSNWKMTPVESNKWLDENMLPYYPLGDIKVPNEGGLE